jgi:hypothetical protein
MLALALACLNGKSPLVQIQDQYAVTAHSLILASFQQNSKAAAFTSYACSMAHSGLSWWGLKSSMRLHVAHMDCSLKR